MSDRISVEQDLRREFQKLRGVGSATATRCAAVAMEYLDTLIENSSVERDDPCYAFPWSLFDAAEGTRVTRIEIMEEDERYVFMVMDPDGCGHCCGDEDCEDNGVDYNKIPDRFKSSEFDEVELKRPSDV